MSEYSSLLTASIDHLRQLKAQGVRYLPANPELLAALRRAPNPVSKRVLVSSARSDSPKPAQTMPKAVAISPNTTPMNVGRVSSSAVSTLGSPPPAIHGEGGGSNSDERAGSAHADAAQAASPSHPHLADGISTADKAARFAELRRRVLACQICPHLAAARRSVVFGVGSIDAALMFVGEAPGADEDEQGEPFVGKAGQLLTKIIETMGLSRQTVYIANILKCRPDTPGQDSGNRKPTAEEMAACSPYLLEQIDLIRPRVLVALGGTAVEGLLGKTVGITKLRGQWQAYHGTPLMPTYHPAYLLRNQSLSEKRKVWEDMLQVMERLQMPISEKQRGYFLKPN